MVKESTIFLVISIKIPTEKPENPFLKCSKFHG